MGERDAHGVQKGIEKRTGKSVITSENAAELSQIVADLIEGVVEDKG